MGQTKASRTQSLSMERMTLCFLRSYRISICRRKSMWLTLRSNRLVALSREGAKGSEIDSHLKIIRTFLILSMLLELFKTARILQITASKLFLIVTNFKIPKTCLRVEQLCSTNPQILQGTQTAGRRLRMKETNTATRMIQEGQKVAKREAQHFNQHLQGDNSTKKLPCKFKAVKRQKCPNRRQNKFLKIQTRANPMFTSLSQPKGFSEELHPFSKALTRAHRLHLTLENPLRSRKTPMT